MELLNYIKQKYKSFIYNQHKKLFTTDFEEPYQVTTIKAQKVFNILKEHCKPENIYLSDWNYGLTTKTEAERFTKESNIHYRNYIKEKHDCDEFSLALYQYWNEPLANFTFGIAWSKTHAFNIFISHKNEVYIVEPQSNKWFKIEDIKDIKQYYPFRIVLL